MAMRIWLPENISDSVVYRMNFSLHVSVFYVDLLDIASEVNRQYFQQVLLCSLKALYYAGICSCAACIILCSKLCQHNSPRPSGKAKCQTLSVVGYSKRFLAGRVWGQDQ